MGKLIVYCLTNTINNKKYIGIDRRGGERIKQHFRRAKRDKGSAIQLIDRKIYEYLPDNFEYRILEVCNSIEEMKKREQFFITSLDTYIENGNGYNLTFGGDGSFGFKMTREQIAKISGKNNSQYGKKRTKEEKKIRSITMKGKNAGEKNVSKRPDVREKLSEFAKTRTGEANSNFRHHIQKDVLFNYYIKNNHSFTQTVSFFGCSVGTIVRRLKEYGISKRKL